MLFTVNKLSYSTNNFIFNDISFNLDKSSEITIIGKSGLGKSTLLKILAQFISPISGDIYYNDKSIYKYALPLYRQKVSYCIQNPTLFGITVKENLDFPFYIKGISVDRNQIYKLLDYLLLDKEIYKRNIKTLSGGERQRIAIIRNILLNPDILLLDEANDGLDDKVKCRMRQLLNKIKNSGTSIISVTHDKSFISSKSQILNLNDYGVEKNA